MKNLATLLVLLAFAFMPAFAQTNIDEMEYFFDSDPGLGNGVPIAILTGPNQNVDIAINTSGLTVGFHVLVIRAKHQSGNWGVQDSRTVYIASESVGNVGVLNAMEYYIDSDPGQGNGTPVTIPGAPSVDVVASIPTSLLAAGFHVLHIRARDDGGAWGIPDLRPFYVVPGAVNTQGTIVQLEYFFDTEPGYGAGTSLTVTNGTQVNLAAMIGSATLSSGFHTIGIRAKDSDGQWGFAESRTFYVDLFSQVSFIEYFVDTDPGDGNATSIAVTTNGTINVDFNIPTSALAAGGHMVGVRAGLSDGSWGTTSTSSFSVFETQTITFGALPAVKLGDAPFALTGTSSSGLALLYTSSNPLVATISGSTVTIVGAGTTDITASQPGNGTYDAAADVVRTLTVATDHPPALTAQAISSFYLNGAVVINNALAISDADGTLTSATVSITSGFQSAEDQLLFDSQNGIAGAYNNTTGILTISGSASVANYQTALRTVRYSNSASSANTVDRTITFQVNDGTSTSNSVVATITINKPPVIDAPAKETQAGGNIVLLTDEIFSDPDNNLDLSTLIIVSAHGALVTISGEIVTINYQQIPEYQGTDQLTITVCDVGGKCQTQVVSVDVGALVDVFNGVSPNGDDMNDYMRIRFLPPESRVTIINRWGDVVFESKDYDNNDPSKRFEGNTTSGNALTNGTYFYKVVVPGGTEYTGYLQLKR